jgi:streptogramin lyase
MTPRTGARVAARRLIARATILTVSTVAALVAFTASASALPLGTIVEHPITGNTNPYAIVVGPDGNLWYTEPGTDPTANSIGEMNPSTLAFTEYQLPTAGANVTGIAVGPDGNIWFTEEQASQIGEINPTTHVIHEYPTLTPNSQPQDITAGPDGNMWFTEYFPSNIGEINPTTGVVHEYPVTSSSGPWGITAGPDGNLWFTAIGNSKIGEINPTTHAYVEYNTPTASSEPQAITTGPDGNLWFTEPPESSGADRIGEINPITDATSDFATSGTGADPAVGITTGPDGNVWFTEDYANKIGEINPTTHAIDEFATGLTGSAQPGGITVGPDGNLWFTEASNVSKIGQIGANAPAAVNAAPVVAGSAQAGTQQVCEGELWNNWAGQQPSLGAFAFDGYQWSLDGTPISGQTNQAYTPTAANVGHTLSCTVTATYALSAVTTVATSAGVTVIAQSSGPTGSPGANGGIGPAGPAGAQGAQGAAGEVEVVTCTKKTTTVKGKKHTKQVCTTKLSSSPQTFTVTNGRAILMRGGHVYASGGFVKSRLVLRAGTRVPAGRYTLIVISGRSAKNYRITLG